MPVGDDGELPVFDRSVPIAVIPANAGIQLRLSKDA
ncbi:MAG: hypothetical protein FD118_3461, partial [Rhodocyclaceae bacterium]